MAKETTVRLWARLARTARRSGGAALLAAVALLSGPPTATAQDQGAAPPACETGTSLLPRLAADGRLATIEAAVAKVPHNTGRFYRIEKDGLPPSYLFGTMHLSDPRVLDLPPAVDAARDEAETVVIETLDVLDQGAATLKFLAYTDLINLPAGRTLDDYLTPPEKREVEALLAAQGTPYAAIRTLQPWLFVMGHMLPPCEVVRAAAGARVLDDAIATDAKAAGKRAIGLESLEEQLRALASMRMELQTASLIATLRMRGELPNLFETMTQFYLDGRIAAIMPLAELMMPMQNMPETVRTAYRDYEQTIVVDRNHRMAERLAPHLAKGGVFVAVGAAHLPDAEGLVELLTRQGFRVSRAD